MVTWIPMNQGFICLVSKWISLALTIRTKSTSVEKTSIWDYWIPLRGEKETFFHSLTRFVKPLDGPIWGIKYLLLPLMPINTRDHNGRLNYTSFIPNSFHCTGDWNCLHFSCSYKDHISNQRSSNQISLTFNPIKSSTVLNPFLLQSDN